MARPRALRLQFSLRLLLLAFTAFAVGFPIWYRWPYEETELHPGGIAKRITTWQRQWGGGRRKHGSERLVERGKVIERVMYRNGLRHGPYESNLLRGQFVNDLREGVWTGRDRTMTWHLGKLDGPTEIRLPPERPAIRPPPYASRIPASREPSKTQLMFANGRLTHYNGKPAANRLFDLQDSDLLDDQTQAELGKETTFDVVEMPLKDTIFYLSELHGIPFVLDPMIKSNIDLPLTGEYRGIDLCSALLLLTAPHGLGCDYRYGCIWITTAEDCNDWHDPTGVSNIKPPKGSPLAHAWNEPMAVDFIESPLVDALKYIEQLMVIDIDTSRVQSAAGGKPISVTLTVRGQPLRNVLGQLLYRSGCRCELQGDKLVISPPEK